MFSEESDVLQSKKFIKGWLNHFNMIYESGKKISRKKNCLDFIIPECGIGIMVPDWNKPLSVKIINTGVSAIQEYDLSELYVVASKVSLHAEETVKRLNVKIHLVHPLGLSALAINLANKTRINQNNIEVTV